ncbi:RNA-directed DNA polymerase from mobile element jockey [Eumeta japonica]|uniref:RNA-directed DNA polymerase from mobile element jockey n=1 Tax=Eumeta variegata TaxID=151549 RepID=A0A4C2A827_EUMVA|nr:RNA-directed DNA polymerase from mobile element jockey [Eumeta japonica]
MVAVTKLFNRILRTGIAIPKAGKEPRLASSQCPITLLSHIAMLFERIADLARVLHYMAAEHNRDRRTVQIFFDFEKAFDRAWHFGLLHKLLANTQILPVLVRKVASFLEVRDFFAAVEEAISNRRPMRAGVLQGSCPSPSLYAVFTDDFPKLAGQLSNWEENVVVALYAYDSDYLASPCRADLAVAKLQRVLDLLLDWMDKCRVAVNVTKTAALLTGQQRIMPPKQRLRGLEVEWQTRVPYLGAQIDCSMRMAAQVEHVTHLSRAARIMLCLVLRSHLPLRKLLCIRTTSVHGLRTQHQHSTYFVPYHIGRGSKPSRTSPYG